MLKNNEMKVLKVLLEDFSAEINIHEISKILKQKYPQTYKTVIDLVKSDVLTIKKIGKSKILKLNFDKYNTHYSIAEIERSSELCKNKILGIIRDHIFNLNKNFICILFGSQTKGYKQGSDIDLLFILPEEYDINNFEKISRRNLTMYNCDIQVVNEKSMLEMWSNPLMLNVGNEILKNHIIFYNGEHFFNLLRRHYVGK